MELSHETRWLRFENGQTVGQHGSEGGTIILDEVHAEGARITLEHIAKRRLCRAPVITFAITCGVYDWMVHTRFFTLQEEATQAFQQMKAGLEQVLAQLPPEDAPDRNGRTAEVPRYLQEFIARFS
jgi:hypothetical protein